MAPHWQRVVFTSLPCIFTPFPEWVMSIKYHPDKNQFRPRVAVMIVATIRAIMLWTGILIWHDATHRNVGIGLVFFSFVFLNFNYVLVTTGDNLKRSSFQDALLLFTLFFPDTNWLFDLGGSPGLRLVHFAVLTLNTAAIIAGLYSYYVADPLHAAWGCYPRHVSWVDYKYGLCPAFTGSPQTSYVCRHFDDNFALCDNPVPPPVAHKPIFGTLLHTSITLYVMSALEKYESYT